MNIDRTVLANLTFPYAVSLFDCLGGPRVVVATELPDKCLSIGVDKLDQEVIWTDKGGTMNLWQINDEGEFFAVQDAFKGFNSRTSCVAKVTKRNGEWHSRRFFEIPFLHRFCMIMVRDVPFMLLSCLCKDKESREDWSQAGATYLMRLPKDLSSAGEATPLIADLHKNHGMFVGRHRGRDVVMVSGQEGLFEIPVPDDPDAEWAFEKLSDREISDMFVYDIDGDGEEEIITIEKFHGSKLVINKMTGGGLREIYSHPVDFGHCLWAGELFGRRSIIVGYRGLNGALVLLQPREMRDEDIMMDVTYIDEHEGPTNFAVVERNGVYKVFSCSTAKDRVVLYEISRG